MMQRTLEPELMNDAVQALAYAEADFDEPHDMFIQVFKDTFPENKMNVHVLDMGCGSADISIRFAKAYPNYKIDGLDGAPRMLAQGELAIQKAQLQNRICLLKGLLPNADLPRDDYDVIISNSLLHHLHDPDVLWKSIKQFGVSGSQIFIMDLMRPKTKKIAKTFVNLYAGDEPKFLQEDFYNSLCAAFLPEEIESQLALRDLSHFKVKILSDRHVFVFGTL